MDESTFKVRFNLQNLLKEDIDEGDFNRIAGILDIDANTVEKLISGFRKSVENQAKVLDKGKKYSSLADENPESKVIFIGDSITSDRESFTHIISSVFSEIPGIKFINAGVSGWRTTEFLDDFHFKVLAHKAHAAHVMLGTNGVRRSRLCYGKCNVSPKEYEKNIRYILRALRENAVKTIISTLPPYDLGSETYDIGNWTINKEDYDEYNAIIIESSKYENCVLNDMRDVYSSFGHKEVLEEDGVHLNKQGHYILAEQVIERLIGILNK